MAFNDFVSVWEIGIVSSGRLFPLQDEKIASRQKKTKIVEQWFNNVLIWGLLYFNCLLS